MEERRLVDEKDRRIFQRISLNLPVRLTNLLSGWQIKADTCDLSAKGVGVVSRDSLTVGDIVDLKLQVQDKAKSLSTRGRVVWTDLQEGGIHRSGILLERTEFMKMSRIFRNHLAI